MLLRAPSADACGRCRKRGRASASTLVGAGPPSHAPSSRDTAHAPLCITRPSDRDDSARRPLRPLRARSERAPRSLYSSRSRRRWIPTRTLNGEHTCLIVTKVAMHTACIQSDRIYQMIQHPLITHERAPHLERHASRRGRAGWDKASNCSSRRSRPCCRGLSQLRPSQLRSTICLSPCRLRPPLLRPRRPNHLRPSHHLVGRALLEPSKPPALPPPDMYRISEVHEAAVAVCAGRHTARRS